MLMNKQNAFARFGSYLSVQVGRYDSISEHLGDYEAARKNNTVGDDRPYEWYFPNTKAGLAAAKKWALESRIELRTDKNHRGIVHREALMETTVIKIRTFRAFMLRDKKFLRGIKDYKAETVAMIAENEADRAANVKFYPLKDELDLGLILDIGAKVYVVGNNHGGVTINEYEVTGYSTYDCWDSSTVDVIIHNNFGTSGGKHNSHIPNEYKGGSTGYVNQKIFYTKSEAKEQARVWAQELVDKNSEWL